MSWINVPEDHSFPIQNLPYGIFSSRSRNHFERRIGIAIGDFVLDLKSIHYAGLLDGLGFDARVFTASTLNDYMALNKSCWRATRSRISSLLSIDSLDRRLRDDHILQQESIFPASEVEMHLPANIGDYTDFYSSKEHATNVGIMFRGVDNALQPNWLHLPVGYHGRASSLVISGTDVTRPHGQLQKTAANPGAGSTFGPSKQLDFELEMAYFVGGMVNPLGQPITMSEAEDRIFGVVIMNDWSARDVQAWEYVPLGPFTSKNFCTSISPWVVSMDALEPFKCVPSAGPVQSPTPLPYILDSQYELSGFDVKLQVSIQPECSSHASIVSVSNMKNLYWNAKQQLVHHSITGCPMKPGDLLGTGTISGPTDSSMGSMLELSWKGTRDVPLGVTTLEDSKEILDLDNPWILRKFVEDGDTVIMSGYAEYIPHSQADENGVKKSEERVTEGLSGTEGKGVDKGYRVGFGSVTGKVLRALPMEYFSADSAAAHTTTSSDANHSNQIHAVCNNISKVTPVPMPLPSSTIKYIPVTMEKPEQLFKSAPPIYTDFKLFSYWRSTCSWRVRIALALKKIPYEYVPINILARYDKAPSQSEEQSSTVTKATFGVLTPISQTLSTPLNQVPVLEFKSHTATTITTGGVCDVLNSSSTTHTLTQSLAIIEFLDDLYPTGMAHDQHPLVPKDPLLRARVRQIADIVASGIQPLQAINILRLVEKVDIKGVVGNGVSFAKWKTEEGLDALEALLSEIHTEKLLKNEFENKNKNQNQNIESDALKEANILLNSSFSSALFAAGTNYPTLADLCIIPQIYNARCRLHIPVNNTTHPRLTAVCALCESLNAFKIAAPDCQPDAVAIL